MLISGPRNPRFHFEKETLKLGRVGNHCSFRRSGPIFSVLMTATTVYEDSREKPPCLSRHDKRHNRLKTRDFTKLSFITWATTSVKRYATPGLKLQFLMLLPNFCRQITAVTC